MRILFPGFMIFLLWAIPCRYWYMCKIKNHCDREVAEGVSNPTDADARTHDLALIKGEEMILKDKEQFLFPSGVIEGDLSANNKLFLDEVAAWLVKNPQEKLTLQGRWRPSEEGQTSGFYENLGIARAAWVRGLLVERGIREDRISLDHQEAQDDKLAYPIHFSSKVINAEETEEEQQAGAFTFTNINFSGANFESNSAAFVPNPTFIAYADSLISFMALEPDKSVTVTGHTDHIGTDASNKILGMQRAESVKAWLQKRGLKGKVVTQSAGEKEPMADNTTEEGRAKNRRVNLIIK